MFPYVTVYFALFDLLVYVRVLHLYVDVHSPKIERDEISARPSHTRGRKTKANKQTNKQTKLEPPQVTL